MKKEKKTVLHHTKKILGGIGKTVQVVKEQTTGGITAKAQEAIAQKQMTVQLPGSAIVVLLPEGYEKLKAWNPVSAAANRTKPAEIYRKQVSSSLNTLEFTRLAEDEGMRYQNITGVVSELRSHLTDRQGIIQVRTGETVQGFRYVYALWKATDEAPSGGLTYYLHIHLTATSSDRIQIAGRFQEIGMIGQREKLSMSFAQQLGMISVRDDGAKGWAEDPYNPDWKSGCLKNLGELEGLDGLFPENPLTQARELLLAVRKNELVDTSWDTLEDGWATAEASESDFEDEEHRERLKELFLDTSRRRTRRVEVTAPEKDAASKDKKANELTGAEPDEETDVSDRKVLKAEKKEQKRREKEARRQEKEAKKQERAAKKRGVEETEEPERQETGPEPKGTGLAMQLNSAAAGYNGAYALLSDHGMQLLSQRIRAAGLINHVECLISSIAFRPKAFDAVVEEIRTARKEFRDACDFVQEEVHAAWKDADAAGAAALAAMAPTAAVWVATAFGTDAAGVAIAILSGAAAESVPQDWLNAGASEAEGDEMAAGLALLGMSGPLSCGESGIEFLNSIGLFADQKTIPDSMRREEIAGVLRNTEQLNRADTAVSALLRMTDDMRIGLNRQYMNALSLFGKDFRKIPTDGQMQLGAIVNSAHSLAQSLSQGIREAAAVL